MRGCIRFGIVFCVVLAAMVPGTMARAGHPAHYIVFELDAKGVPRAVFEQLVELATPLESLSPTEFARAEAATLLDGSVVTLRLSDASGGTLFRSRVNVPSMIRGEFAGEPDGSGGFQIESHRFTAPTRAFAVRVPVVGEARFDFGGAARGSASLNAIVSAPLRAAPFAAPELLAVSSPANRLDVLIMGDGYTAAEGAAFDSDADDFEAAFFSISPYSEYENYVNVTRLHVPSNESGADHPPYNAACSGDNPACCSDSTMLNDPLAGTYVDTAFDSRFCAFQIHRLLAVDITAVLIAAAAVPDYDKIVVLVNDTTYGGSGGFLSVTSTNPFAADVVRHEFGHSFTDLADEYDSPFPGFPACSDTGGSPCEANVSDVISPPKWSPWIDGGTPIPTPETPTYDDDVGAFEGARYLTTGMYRPRNNDCLMHFLGKPFCEICSQSYILRLYQGGWGEPVAGIDPIEPGSEEPVPGTVMTTCGVTLSADLLAPIGGPPLDVLWTLDGNEVVGETGSSYAFLAPDAGSYDVELRVEDVTNLVHPDMVGSSLESSRSWTVEVSGDSASCHSPSAFTLGGTGAGGSITLRVSGSFGDVLIVVSTGAGGSAETVAAALAAAINVDPTLATAGVTASANGARLSSNGAITLISIDDPGLELTASASDIPVLNVWGTLLLGSGLLALVAARRRAV